MLKSDKRNFQMSLEIYEWSRVMILGKLIKRRYAYTVGLFLSSLHLSSRHLKTKRALIMLQETSDQEAVSISLWHFHAGCNINCNQILQNIFTFQQLYILSTVQCQVPSSSCQQTTGICHIIVHMLSRRHKTVYVIVSKEPEFLQK